MSVRRLSVLPAILSGCIAIAAPSSEKPVPPALALDPAPPVRGGALLVPGLNNRPDVLLPLGEIFAREGWAVRGVCLPGHDGDVNVWRSVRADDWVSAVEHAFAEREPTTPASIAFGYSLGATALLEALRGAPEDRLPDALILAAPALAPNRRSSLLRLLAPLRYTGLAVPSRAPEDLRVFDGTSLSAYHALFELIDRVSPVDALVPLARIPTLVILFDGDELLDNAATIEWIEERKLPWTVRFVFPDSELPHHLGVHPRGAGDKAWKHIEQEIVEFLSASKLRSRGE